MPSEGGGQKSAERRGVMSTVDVAVMSGGGWCRPIEVDGYRPCRGCCRGLLAL